MIEDSFNRVSSSESDSFTTKQRKKRKWDQPDESLISAVPGIFPLANMGPLASITLPTISSIAGVSHHSVPLSGSNAAPQIVVPVPLQQHAATVVQKLVQPKIQDELIAREIVINDADSAIRYKLTKRQTQEEIQRSTGAVVITRGKYRPPNASPDGERPLYLHISAAAHLETTAERIKAVDLAAAMVEEMLKQGPVAGGMKVDHLLSTCIFLGIEANPSMNIASRVCGPNDQFINHIIKETGASVLLRGRGSGHFENGETEETQQPFHLLLSCNDAKGLERAKLLAENLLDTISVECGASRLSSSKVYCAVPPPPQLQFGVESPMNNISTVNGSTVPTDTIKHVTFPVPIPQSIGLTNPLPHLPNTAFYSPTLTSGTSYIGYGGIYPQATPLQQVAQVLRQSASPVTAPVDSTITSTSLNPPLKENAPAAKDKRPHKRKFQELPAGTNRPANANQGSEFSMPRELTSHVGARDVSEVVQDPKKPIFKPPREVMPPPPPVPRNLSPPPPPPRLNYGDNNVIHKPKSEREHVPDTLTKLMEYGDDEDDDDDDEQSLRPVNGLLENHSCLPAKSKPFWAV